MPWLYRLQSRAGLTGPEGTAILVLALALAGGLVVRHAVASAAPPAPALYAAADAAFARADAGTAVALGAPPILPLVPGADTTASAGTVPDSTAAASVVADAAVEASAARSRGRKPPPVPTNLNTASETELQRLPRVGPAIAARIVAYRQANGPFRRPEDVQEVKGIGPKTFETLAPWIRL